MATPHCAHMITHKLAGVVGGGGGGGGGGGSLPSLVYVHIHVSHTHFCATHTVLPAKRVHFGFFEKIVYNFKQTSSMFKISLF